MVIGLGKQRIWAKEINSHICEKEAVNIWGKDGWVGGWENLWGVLQNQMSPV